MIDSTLFSKGRRAILLYFLMNPSISLHVRELADRLSFDPGNLSRELKTLSAMGLFEISQKGRMKFFSLNKKHPLFKEIRGLLLKTEGTPHLLRQALKPLKNEIHQAFLYGSFAAGKPDAESDIDLMVIGAVNAMDLARVLRPVEKRLGREIHFRILEKSEFDKRLKSSDPFLKDVVGGKTLSIVDPS